MKTDALVQMLMRQIDPRREHKEEHAQCKNIDNSIKMFWRKNIEINNRCMGRV